MAADRHRLFVALLPSDPARAALAALADDLAHARWTPPEQLHLTLRFIGEVSDGQRDAVRAALEEVRVAPFLLGVENVGRFPPRGQPGVIWAGVGGGHPFLHELRRQVDDRLLATDVEFELTPFVPHFTLARTRECKPAAVEQCLKRNRAFVGPIWRIEAFHLMESLSAPTGVRHEIAASFPLRSAGA